ncbi:hypothetical protein D3C71_1395150 [compost metagenome]
MDHAVQLIAYSIDFLKRLHIPIELSASSSLGIGGGQFRYVKAINNIHTGGSNADHAIRALRYRNIHNSGQLVNQQISLVAVVVGIIAQALISSDNVVQLGNVIDQIIGFGYFLPDIGICVSCNISERLANMLEGVRKILRRSHNGYTRTQKGRVAVKRLP